MALNKVSSLWHGIKHKKLHALALLCAAVMLVSVFPPLYTSAATYGDLYEGWKHITQSSDASGHVSLDSENALIVDAMGGTEALYLNRETGDGNDSGAANISKFDKDTMTDFVIEFDMAVFNYKGKDKVDAGNAGEGGGAVSLAYMALDAERLDASSITARIDYAKAGQMWREYSNGLLPPKNYQGSYVDGKDKSKYKEWHWLFNNGETVHVKVTKNGYNVTMDINNGTYVFASTVAARSGSGTLPEAGYVGLLVEDAGVKVTNMTVTNTTGGANETATFFVPKPATGDLYDGWVHLSQDDKDRVTVNENNSLTIDAMGSDNEFFYLNQENSGEENRIKYGKNMKDFIIEMDLSVQDYLGKAAVDGGNLAAGNGAISLAFMGLHFNRLDVSSITARVDYANAGLMWRQYDEVAMPPSYTYSYIDGKVLQQWHNMFNNGKTYHLKVVKTGYTLMMEVNGSSYTVALPDNIGLPESGYVGLMLNGVKATISNVQVTNTTGGDAIKNTYFAPEGATDPKKDLYEGWLAIPSDGQNRVTYNEETRELIIDGLGSTGEALYLNNPYGDATLLEKYGKDMMSDFIIEFDARFLAFDDLGDADAATGDGELSLGVLGTNFLDPSLGAITARTDYTNLCMMWRGYNGIENPYQNTYGILGFNEGQLKQWHWYLLSDAMHHYKFKKSGNTLTMIVDGQSQFVHELPAGIGLPESGYISFLIRSAKVALTNVQVTNLTTGDAQTFFGDKIIYPEVGPEASQIEGWQHFRHPLDIDNYIQQDPETGKLTFHCLDSSGEMLFLNADTCPQELLDLFGKDMMGDFTVEYDIKLDATGPTGGQLSFGFMGIDDLSLLEGAITAGHTNDHNCFWWRGYNGIQMPSEYEWSVVGWPDGFLDPTFKATGRTYRVVVNKSGWTISMSVDDCYPVEIDLPSDIGLPESGYMGFFASNAKGTIGNVVVTNDTTGEKKIFFGDGETDAEGDDFIPTAPESTINPDKPFKDLEGWSAFCNEQADGETHYYQREGDGALFFDGMGCTADFIYLNAEYTQSEAGKENRELFGMDMMQDYTINFDFSLRDATSGMGALNFIIQSANQVNPGYSSVVLQMNGTATGLKYEYADVGQYGLLPDCNPTNVMLGDTLHFVTIEKRGNVLTVYLDGFVAWEDVILPEVVQGASPNQKQKLPDSGFIGFWFRNAQGYIANVEVINETTGATKKYFEDFNDTIDFWKLSGGDTTNALAMTPEKGVGIHGVNYGEAPDNTMVKYTLPLQLDGLSFTFVPKVVTDSYYDDQAWVGFALTDNEKDYNLNNAAKSSGFLAQIAANTDGTGTVTFMSLLPDGDYGDYKTVATIENYAVNQGYEFSFKLTAGGVEVYLNGEKLTLLDWLKGEVYGANHYCYLTTTASCTDGFEQAWAVTTINGENAVDYDSGLFDDGDDGWDDDWGDFDDEWDDEWNDNGDYEGEYDSPITGESLLGLLAAFALLTLSALVVFKVRKKA